MIEIPTAGGKSFIIANYIWNMWKNVDRKMKFLLLVPNTQLVEQFWKDLVDYLPISDNTIRDHLQDLPFHIVGGTKFYNKNEVDEYLLNK